MSSEEQKDPKQEQPQDATGGGQQPEPRQPEQVKQEPSDEARFTSTQVEDLIKRRLAQQAKKYADFDALQEKAKRWAEYEEAQKSELEKAVDRANKAEAKQEAALREANDRLIKAAFIARAGQLRAKHPEDAFMLADLSNVVIDDGGKVQGVEDAVQTLVDEGRLPIEGRPQAPSLDAGAGSGERTQEKTPKLTDEQLKMAKNLGVKPEDYAKYATTP